MPSDKIPAARLTDLIRRPPVKYPAWVDPVILPKGGVFLFGGHSKIGKSFQAMEMARAISTGSSLFGYGGFPTHEAKVLMLEREIGEFGLQSRAATIFRGENLDKISDNLWYVSQDPDLSLDTHAGIGRIGDHIDQTGAEVLILDPISHMHSGDENDNSDINTVFTNLEGLRKQFRHRGLAIVIAHHFGKPPTGKFAENYDHLNFHNFRGASKFFSAPDTICTSWRCEELNLPWEAWRLKVRWVCRQGESPPEMYLTVNQNQDLRVRWERNVNENRVIENPGLRNLRFSPAS